MAEQYNAVAEPTAEYKDMLPDWAMVDTVYSGTRAMREAGEAYLPRFEAESNSDYTSRLNATVLFNMYRKACEALTGKAFKKPVVLQDDVPASLREWAENIDREGRQINVFAKDLFHDAIRRGMSHFMVDFPRSTAQTREEQKRNGERPYWIHMPANEIIGWREENINGQRVLAQLRRQHTVSLPAGEFSTKVVERVTVYERGSYRVFEKVENKQDGGNAEEEWVPAIDEDGNPLEGSTGLNYIPLVTLYTNRTGFMQAKPPLMDLAHKNVEHWQSSSDQRNILKWSRFAVAVATGWTEDEDQMKFGPNTMIKISNPDGDFKFASAGSDSIEPGFKDLENIKEEMAYLALDPMLRQPGNVTATARALDGADASSQLEGWMNDLKDAIEVGLQFSADRGQEGRGGSVQVNDDFAVPVQDNDAQVILSAHKERLLPRKVALESLMRVVPAMGAALEGQDLDDVIGMIAAEGRANPAFDRLRQTLGAGE